ncbi:MAG: GTP-binding protein [Candidatus Lokiarchaeota archaeon]|nr:GTP-binding protein [Candidatus Lokiarchaeota archaeon]MBD3200777.1 GTP-binding protein [Candidatus Lokiarchaeota archaeon]
MSIEDKIPINIGLFGHIDSGKTAVVEVLSEIISTAGIDAHPQSKERGITIDLGFTSFMLDKYLVTLVDGPGHADLIKISASSVEIIDLAIVVIDINKGPQIQTGEHLIMIDSLDIHNIIVVLNKKDIFSGDLDKTIRNIRDFFKSTIFGSEVPIFTVSAKEKTGFEDLKGGILKRINQLEISRDEDGHTIIPIDHHFVIKGRGSVITGTLVSGRLVQNQELYILPLDVKGRVKNIQIFHKNVQLAKAGHRVGVNMKNINVKNIYRGCYATDDPKAFDYCDIIEVKVKKSELFKLETSFGTQVHITIGMISTVGKIYPYHLINEKRIRASITSDKNEFNALLWLNESTLMRKKKNIMLLSRLDLPPTMLRILGSAELLKIHENPPLFYKYKRKKGKISNPDQSQGIVCVGLAQSLEGAKTIVGKKLEHPFTKVIDTFGTKGAVIVGVKDKTQHVVRNDDVILKELRSFNLKKI